MNRNSTLNVVVEAGGSQVVAHAGLHALGRFADRVGLGRSLSAAIPWNGERGGLAYRSRSTDHDRWEDPETVGQDVMMRRRRYPRLGVGSLTTVGSPSRPDHAPHVGRRRVPIRPTNGSGWS